VKGRDKMDTFCEQLVKRAPTTKENIKKALILFLALFLGGIIFLLASYYLGYIFGFLFGGVIFFLGFYLMGMYDYEYEYIVTNGEIDIDKIIAKRKRKRILSVSAKSFTAFKKLLDSDKLSDQVMSIDVSDGIDVNKYYAEFKLKDQRQIALIFSPDEKTLGSLNHYISRTIRS
jgi:hypothetical protein